MSKKYDCGYRGCCLWDIPHDHHIHPGDVVEWYNDDNELTGVARVLACYMINNWAYYDLGIGQKVRYDRVRWVNEVRDSTE